MASFEDMIMQLSNGHATTDPDPEDDAGDLTAAKVTTHQAEEEVVQSTQLRRRAAAYLESDKRYQGKKISRKDLYYSSPEASADDPDSEDSDELDTSDDEENATDSELEDERKMMKFEGSESDESAVGGDEDGDDSFAESDEIEGKEEEEMGEESEEFEEDEEVDSDVDDVEITEKLQKDEDDSKRDEAVVNQLEKLQKDEDNSKRDKAVVNQLDLWDRLMEARIKLQKTLTLVNKIPVGVQLQENEEQKEVQSLLQELGCQYCGLVHSLKSSPRKRKADTDADEVASEEFTSYQSERNNTLTFWDDKTRLTSKKFKSFNSFNTNVLKQIEQILSDKDRLIRRTQVSRDEGAAQNKPEEVFDDNDFYQRLLRQLVENKAESEVVASVTQTQWLELQKMREKKKKKEVDTRASKGRKLRYNVHPKLVNFMAPRDDSTWSEEAKKRKADTDADEVASEEFTSYQSQRNETILFWDSKTHLASKMKKFNSFNTSVLKQIEQILSDKQRLIMRTQVSRDERAAENKPEEVFDDNDFYQHLLRQLVENKAESEAAASATQNQWLEIQKLRVKKKKGVDTRASKGRKLRYNIHPKLVNFMAPRDDSTWSEEAKNDLFKNLFKMPS